MKAQFTIFLAFVATGLAQGQSFYFKAGAGHSFSSSAQNQGINSTNLRIKETDPDAGHYVSAVAVGYSEVKGSLGSGLTLSGAIGMEFDKNFAIEVRLDYVRGKDYVATDYNADITDGVTINSSTADFRRHANSLQISPVISFFPRLEGLRPYLSAGPVFAHARVFEEESFFSNYEGDNFQSGVSKVYQGGLAIGVNGIAGIEKRLSERVSVFAECTYVSLSYFPEEGEMTRYEVNNDDQLPTLSQRQRKTVFVDEYMTDSRSSIDRPDYPGKAIRFSFSLNRIAAIAGLKVKVFSLNNG